jgi:spore coat polysaccharide biosynthesis predicted glycosyltransferase SpsG
MLGGGRPVRELVAAHRFPLVPASDASDGGPDSDGLLSQAGIAGAERLLVDVKTVDREYLAAVSRAGRFVAVMDDLAERDLPCHLVVNGNAYATALPYPASGPEPRLLLGTRYLALQREFWYPPRRVVAECARRVLLTFGGSDPGNLAPRVLNALAPSGGGLEVTVVLGPFAHNAAAVRAAAAAFPAAVRVVRAPENMRELMLHCDLAVSAGGGTLYELACMACPAIAVEVVDDQRHQLRALAESGAAVAAGHVRDLDVGSIAHLAARLLIDVPARRRMSIAGQRLVDGRGAERVASAIAAGFARNREPGDALA